MPLRPILLAATMLAAMSPMMTASVHAAEAAAPAASPADAALARLFHDSDEASLKRNPINGMFRGDMRYADRLGDYVTDDYYAAEKAAAEADLAALHRIDRSKLTPTDRIAYDVFQWQTKVSLKGFAPDLLAVTAVQPVDHFSGFHTFYPGFASGGGAAPFRTVQDYENNLKRHAEYVTMVDRWIARFRQGMKAGVVEPKLVVANMIDQLDMQIAQGVEGSTFYGPVKEFPADISPADQARLRAATAAAIRDGILPAYRRFRTFLKDDYLPVARDSVGLVGVKGGDRLYAHLIEVNTTLPLKAEEVHQLGLSEVARITAEMEKIRTQVGYKGSLAEFFVYLRDDPKFQPASAEWLRDEYFRIGKRVDQRIGEQFSLVPKSPLEIRAVEPYREKTEAGGSYQQGTPDGSRPGVFYYNTYDLKSRTTPGMETLYLHEAVPGHHFQISLAQENATLPAFMRFGGNTAFIEGWALYAETLWKDLGMETDPYQRFGGLSDEMLRAVRLVVDTGIHAKGWTRDQALDYMLGHSNIGKADATAEVERYIAIPGQALAYKIGALTILKLKAKAQRELGAKFDPRAFHAQVLDTGALPMSVLEAKIDAWIKASK
ncbi:MULTISPECIES: DUF885 domain-containing protein [unclassified Sphingomonas]|uniref:DUF885 domain-containing protein n=1 Tax=unclassified Sphingomonas TaxID=196159 RepID=UPI0006FFF3A8|nr:MULTISPECIES: DUF885 domain-containing protein [unclassified Sphingomonas]KQX17537.1 hypothetical protein ASD17_17495 [Sphingomonas sp. Root1294]KQY70463.1 hypothetical protein ASD39_21395 [Sphingomonas sp. Root50]KRB92050.1 hypothetical protein ASE22_08915 [Sphingomonas sp. Root720]